MSPLICAKIQKKYKYLSVRTNIFFIKNYTSCMGLGMNYEKNHCVMQVFSIHVAYKKNLGKHVYLSI